MRFILTSLILLPIYLFSQEKKAETLLESGLKKYEIENGKIVYIITGGASGTETFIFDDFGWQSVKKRNMQFELYGAERQQTQHEVIDGNVVFRINHKDSIVQKRIDPKWMNASSTMDSQKASESILFSMGGTHKSDSIVLGHKCQVWTFEGKALQELWIWKGLVLKRKTKLSDKKIITTASEVYTSLTIDEKVFDLPANYKIDP